MVFQEYALFPWMTVEDNITFGLRIKKDKEDPARIEAVLGELLKKLKLTEFRKRFPKDLSGGMRQRVAIARVLALDPPIMLMDEPFGALDALTRRSLQDELLKLWQETKKTVVFVTHSMEEAIYLADIILVMSYRPRNSQERHHGRHPTPQKPSRPSLQRPETRTLRPSNGRTKPLPGGPTPRLHRRLTERYGHTC